MSLRTCWAKLRSFSPGVCGLLIYVGQRPNLRTSCRMRPSSSGRTASMATDRSSYRHPAIVTPRSELETATSMSLCHLYVCITASSTELLLPLLELIYRVHHRRESPTHPPISLTQMHPTEACN